MDIINTINIKVGTFNLENLFVIKNEPDTFKELMSKEKPDILFTQEVCDRDKYPVIVNTLEPPKEESKEVYEEESKEEYEEEPEEKPKENSKEYNINIILENLNDNLNVNMGYLTDGIPLTTNCIFYNKNIFDIVSVEFLIHNNCNKQMSTIRNLEKYGKSKIKGTLIGVVKHIDTDINYLLVCIHLPAPITRVCGRVMGNKLLKRNYKELLNIFNHLEDNYNKFFNDDKMINTIIAGDFNYQEAFKLFNFPKTNVSFKTRLGLHVLEKEEITQKLRQIDEKIGRFQRGLAMILNKKGTFDLIVSSHNLDISNYKVNDEGFKLSDHAYVSCDIALENVNHEISSKDSTDNQQSNLHFGGRRTKRKSKNYKKNSKNYNYKKKKSKKKSKSKFKNSLKKNKKSIKRKTRIKSNLSSS